jgi:iron complex outermembrane recepter protein
MHGSGKIFLPSAVLLAALLLADYAPASIQDRQRDLADLSLEELMELEVTQATRKPSRLLEIPAAVDVITSDDMRRTGSLSVPDALRLVPGMEVSRLDASKWAVSARGFNGLYSNKILVLLDGMSLYSPIFSGVPWESIGIGPGDVSRIEVIRGPGATLWGAGAMNGVVNIVTAEAASERGLTLDAGSGTHQKGMVSARYGGAAGTNLFYRVSARGLASGGFENREGRPAGDGWKRAGAGLRADWRPTARNSFSLQAEGGVSDLGQEGNPTLVPGIQVAAADYGITTRSGTVTGRWNYRRSSRSDFSLRASFQGMDRSDTLVLDGGFGTLDVDGQHHVRLGRRHDVVWGAGFRLTRSRLAGDRIMTLDPDRIRFQSTSAFVQDDVDLALRRLRLTLGSKFEDNSLTGFEAQPNIRLAWMPSGRHTFWAAASRAVRLPDPSDFYMAVQYDIPPVRFRLTGNRALQPEELTAIEAGWKTAPSDRFHASVNLYANRYRGLQNYSLGELALIADPPALLIPFTLDNVTSAKAAGAEASVDAALLSNLAVHASAAWIDMRQTWDASLVRRAAELGQLLGLGRSFVEKWVGSENGRSPEWTGSLRIAWNPHARVDADLIGRYVDQLPQLGIPARFDVDARLAWRPTGSCELYVAGRDLARRSHSEFDETPSLFGATRIQRSVFCGMTVRMRGR